MKKFIVLFLFIVYTVGVYATTECAFGEVTPIGKITEGVGGFTGDLYAGDWFCRAENIGDLNGDGIDDLAVGAELDGKLGLYVGAVWILFMKADGTVLSSYKIGETDAVMSTKLASYDTFGSTVAALGDLNEDGINDIAVAAYNSNSKKGVIWILFLNQNGSVKSAQKITENTGGFNEALYNQDYFGIGLAAIGDANKDGIIDIAVGCSDDNTDEKGVIWLLNLKKDGTVVSYKKLANNTGNFLNVLNGGDRFGRTISKLGDINNDGFPDFLTCAYVGTGLSGEKTGVMYVVFLNENQEIGSYQKIAEGLGGFSGNLTDSQYFGAFSLSLGDINEDGIRDIITTSFKNNASTVWLLSIANTGLVIDYKELSEVSNSVANDNQELSIVSSTNWSSPYFEQNGKTFILGNVKDNTRGTNTGAINVFTICSGLPTHFDISGLAYANDTLLSTGIAKLYSEIDAVNPIATTQVINGIFSINSVEKGIYKLYVEPTGVEVADYLPTYFGDVEMSDAGSVINLQADKNDVVVHLVRKHYSLSGTVYAGGKLLPSGIVAAYDAYITATELPVMQTEIVDGEFSFSSLEKGEYKILATPQGSEAEEFYATYFESTILWGGAYILPFTGTVTDFTFSLISKSTQIADLATLQVDIYPNPVNDILFFKTNLEVYNQTLELKIEDISGKTLIKHNYNSNSGTCPVHFLQKGVYVVSLSRNNYIERVTIVK